MKPTHRPARGSLHPILSKPQKPSLRLPGRAAGEALSRLARRHSKSRYEVGPRARPRPLCTVRAERARHTLRPAHNPKSARVPRPLQFVARAAGENGSSGPYSPKCPERLSEKGRRSLQRSATDHPKALFALRTPPISTLLALIVHLFGQSQKVNSPKFASPSTPN